MRKFEFAIKACMAVSAACAMTACQKKPVGPPKTTQAQPAQTQAAPAAPENGPAFDIGSLPVATAPVPEFPIIDWPKDVPADQRSSKRVMSESMNVIVGDKLVARTGTIEERSFSLKAAKMTGDAFRRGVEERMHELGAVKVNTVGPTDAKWMSAQGNDTNRLNASLRLPAFVFASYDAYALRTPERLIWIVAATDVDSYAHVRVLEEKSAAQSALLRGESSKEPA